MNARLLFSLFLILLLGGCATLERDKVASRAVAEKITLYLDVALIQRQDRGNNTLVKPESEALAQRIEQRVRQRLAEKGYRVSDVVSSIAAAPDTDLPATILAPLHQAASRVERKLPAPLRQTIDCQGVMVVTIHGSLKSPLELQREQILDTWREMAGDHEVDLLPEFLVEGHYRTTLYRCSDGKLLWNNWGDELLRHSGALQELVEPAVGSLP